MDQVIEKLSEIEEAASKIIDSADSQKKLLDQQQEERITAYDTELENSTAKEVEKLHTKLSGQLEKELSRLHDTSASTLKALEQYYDANHDALSTEIYKKIIRK